MLEGIREAPEDDTLRLLLSERLEERGVPQGELIKLEVGLANGAVRVSQEVRECQDRLRAIVYGGLGGKLNELGVCHWSYERGFIRHVRVDASQFISKGKAILDLLADQPEVCLTIANIKDNDHLQLLLSCPEMKRITRLGLSNASPFADAQQESLEAIIASGHLKNLRELSLAYCDKDDALVQGLVGSGQLGNLEILDCGNPYGYTLAAVTGVGLEAIARLQGLKRLGLRGNRFLGNANSELFAGLGSIPELTALDLSACELNDASLLGLRASGLRLQSLSLGHNGGITSLGARYLAEWDNTRKNLVHLGLPNNEIRYEGARWLVAYDTAASRLRTLDLIGNPLSRKDIGRLSAEPLGHCLMLQES